MVPTLHPQLAKIVRAVRVSDNLSKVASAEAAAAKALVDAEIFGMASFSVKTASVSNPMREMANQMAELAVGVYGFNKLSASVFDREHWKEVGRKNTPNFLLPLTDSIDTIFSPKASARDVASAALQLHTGIGLPKTAHVTANPILADAVTKLATVGAIEGMLNLLPDTLSPETQKLAMEIRVLNRGYGVQILSDLLA